MWARGTFLETDVPGGNTNFYEHLKTRKRSLRVDGVKRAWGKVGEACDQRLKLYLKEMRS